MLHSALIRRNPSNAAFRDPLFQAFDRFFGDRAWPMATNTDTESATSSNWLPAVDLRETDEAFVVSAELAGLTKKDIEISLEENTLTLSGERKFEKESENDNYHRVERVYGSFRRSFSLPNTIEGDKVSAKFTNGLLTLTIPKSPTVKPRKITVS